MRLTSDEAIASFPMPANHELRVLYVTSACDPDHTISASAFWWVDALARRCARVDVIALETGGQPRHNVVLYSLQRSRYRWRWLVIPRMARLLWRLVPKADVVFCQYSAKFVFASWPFAAVLRKPVVLWWSHAHVDWRLRLATSLVTAVVTASDDSFQLATPKKHVVGHGVDTRRFTPGSDRPPGRHFEILSLGRISPVKDVETMIRAARILRDAGLRKFRFTLIGGTHNRPEERYRQRMLDLSHDLALDGHVIFAGQRPHSEILLALRSADVFVNALAEGGAGRAWLEAMAVGVPTVLCTAAAGALLQRADLERLLFRPADAVDLAGRLRELELMSVADRRALGLRLRRAVVDHHSLERLADILMSVFLRAAGRTAPSAYTGAAH